MIDEAAARIRALDGAWSAAAARRDLDGMMAIYAPDAEEPLPGMPAVVGREAIRDFYRELIERFPDFAHEFEPEEITVAASEDLAVVRGTYRFMPDSGSPEEAQVGKFVGVWCLVVGDWRLKYNISNADAS